MNIAIEKRPMIIFEQAYVMSSNFGYFRKVMNGPMKTYFFLMKWPTELLNNIK